eukprot:442024-Hanusia_phi.AAC.2
MTTAEDARCYDVEKNLKTFKETLLEFMQQVRQEINESDDKNEREIMQLKASLVFAKRKLERQRQDGDERQSLIDMYQKQYEEQKEASGTILIQTNNTENPNSHAKERKCEMSSNKHPFMNSMLRIIHLANTRQNKWIGKTTMNTWKQRTADSQRVRRRCERAGR